MTTVSTNNSNRLEIKELVTHKLVPNQDFIYEYSDLNPKHTRVQVLQGQYKDLIVEFGSSNFTAYSTGKCDFKYDYILYAVPKVFPLEDDEDFKNYLASILITLIQDREYDTNAKEPASIADVKSNIKIPEKFYKK